MIGCLLALFVGLFLALLAVAIIGFGVGWEGTKALGWVISVLWAGTGIALASALGSRN